MVREFVKWDYELRSASHLETVVDRALDAGACRSRRGPSTSRCRARCWPSGRRPSSTPIPPRMVKPGALRAGTRDAWPRRRRSSPPRGTRSSSSRRPGAIPAPSPALVALAEALGAPVFDQFHTYVNFPQDHPLHAGFDAAPHLESRPTPSWSSSPTCRGSRRSSTRGRTRASSTSASTRSSRATRSAAFPMRRGARGHAAPRAPGAGRRRGPARRRRGGGGAAHALGGRARAHASRRRRPGRAPCSPTRRSTWPGSRAASATSLDDQTIVVNEYDLDATQARFRQPGELLRRAAVGRARLGPRRRARGQAGRAGQDGDLLRRRRRLHLRRAHRGALRLARLQPARALRRLQQPHVERGQARRAVARARRLGGQDRTPCR